MRTPDAPHKGKIKYKKLKSFVIIIKENVNGGDSV